MAGTLTKTSNAKLDHLAVENSLIGSLTSLGFPRTFGSSLSNQFIDIHQQPRTLLGKEQRISGNGIAHVGIAVVAEGFYLFRAQIRPFGYTKPNHIICILCQEGDFLGMQILAARKIAAGLHPLLLQEGLTICRRQFRTQGPFEPLD